jgi:hypothetical protein
VRGRPLSARARNVFLHAPALQIGAPVSEPVLDVDKVLLAIEELRRWEQRALEMSKSAARPSPEESARVRQQIAYYSGLLHDMKRRANPDSAPRLMRRFG